MSNVIMKLKERLVAASLGFMAALCLLAIFSWIWPPGPPLTASQQTKAAHQVNAPSSSRSLRQQRNLQKTDVSAGHSEQQIASDQQEQKVEDWSVVRQQKTVRRCLRLFKYLLFLLQISLLKTVE